MSVCGSSDTPVPGVGREVQPGGPWPWESGPGQCWRVPSLNLVAQSVTVVVPQFLLGMFGDPQSYPAAV